MTQKETQCRVVSQIGTVAAVDGDFADIEIVQMSACASCTLRGVCAPGDSAVKTIRARLLADVAPGGRVRLEMDVRHGQLSVLVSYVVPLILVVATLFLVRRVVPRESTAGLAAVVVLMPYYYLVYRLRTVFDRTIQFRAVPAGANGAHKEGAV